jgi:hypothetical protein
MPHRHFQSSRCRAILHFAVEIQDDDAIVIRIATNKRFDFSSARILPGNESTG